MQANHNLNGHKNFLTPILIDADLKVLGMQCMKNTLNFGPSLTIRQQNTLMSNYTEKMSLVPDD